MSVIQKIKSVFGDGSTATLRTYECHDCDETFESAKTPDRAQCPECLANDVSEIGKR